MKGLLLLLTGISLGMGVMYKLQPPAPKMEKISPELQKEIDYGRELFVHTSRYLGVMGSVEKNMQTRMNCQNCHLDGGRKPYGISLTSTHARYPEYRARSGKILTLADRINNCIERPMNGKPLAHDSREMKAYLAYFFWLARGTPTGSTAKGGNMLDLVNLPTYPASTERGKHIYGKRCVECHGDDGQGKLSDDYVEYLVPPLWGRESYNESSNMHRNTKLASFIMANMPLGATFDKPILTYAEALDVAAFINDDVLHPRPKSKWQDYEKIEQKPIDYPVGPYADGFTEEMHRLGPFPQIIESLRSQSKVAYY